MQVLPSDVSTKNLAYRTLGIQGPEAFLRFRVYLRDPSIQILPTLGPIVCKYYLGFTWTPKLCKIMALRTILRGLGLLFYILRGFRAGGFRPSTWFATCMFFVVVLPSTPRHERHRLVWQGLAQMRFQVLQPLLVASFGLADCRGFLQHMLRFVTDVEPVRQLGEVLLDVAVNKVPKERLLYLRLLKLASQSCSSQLQLRLSENAFRTSAVPAPSQRALPSFLIQPQYCPKYPFNGPRVSIFFSHIIFHWPQRATGVAAPSCRPFSAA